VSILGFGGFHLVETSLAQAATLLNTYLDLGGNYVETAADYGNGASEERIGRALENRRGDFYLATKTTARDADGCRASIEASLRRLRTGHLDILFMHSVRKPDLLDAILAPGGAMEAAEQARQAGKVRWIGITAHGRPWTLIEALDRYPFDVLMTDLNYYDRCNFPDKERVLLPKAAARGTGVLAMKPLADGLLFRSVPQAFRYTWSLPVVAAAVAGINTAEHLETDVCLARGFEQMTTGETDELLKNAPELGTYVCRQCGLCAPCDCGVDAQRVFELEGWFDRQMRDGVIRDAAEFGMRERLRFWFQHDTEARQAYKDLGMPARRCRECTESGCSHSCPYGIDIRAKLDIADFKLGTDRLVFG
jgi:predicted aldo/keto reductase-like oxidoreductase